MKIKGESLVVLPEYIKEKFGTSGLMEWRDSLSPEAREIFSSDVKPYEWYDLRSHYLEPVKKICDLFFEGGFQGATEAGRADADRALSGVFRFFVRFGSPGFIVRRASVLFPSYYKESSMRVVEVSQKGFVLWVMEFGNEKMEEINTYTISGWMQRAMELCGCENVVVEAKRNIVDGKEIVAFVARWD